MTITRAEATAAPADPLPDKASREKRPIWIALALLLVLGVLVVLPLRTPAPQPTSAPTTSFSADRALALLPGIASEPHPTGSAAQPRVREYLVGRLRDLGLEPQVSTRVAQAPAELTSLGTVSNIHAQIPGTRPTGSVLLVAHYDSVPTGPGAADDGANVAAILEIARALRAGPAPRNNVDLLLTDGEEEGSLGAQAFVDSGSDLSNVVVVNLEARGVSGPAVMFESAGTGLAPAIRASGTGITSAADAIYRILQNSTDLTVFHQAGMRGLNFAFYGDGGRYHTRHDDIASVSPGSVQDLGDAALAATRSLADADLTEPGSTATYFTLFGVVVSYPDGLVLPLALVAIVGFAALVWWGRRHGLSLRYIGRAAVTFPLVLLLVPIAIWQLGWLALITITPNARLSHGLLPNLAPYFLAELALLILAVIVWYRWVRRRASTADVAAAVIGWFSLLGLVLAFVAPAAVYLATWPALIGIAITAVAFRLNPTVTMFATAVPAVVLLLPVCVMLVPALGLGLVGYLFLAAAVLCAAVAGLAELIPRRRAATAGLAAASVIAVAAFAVTSTVDTASANAPQAVSLGYVLDADTGSAHWISDGDSQQPVVGAKLTEAPRRFDAQVPLLGNQSLHNGPAPSSAASSAQVDVVSATEQDGVRTVRLLFRAPVEAYQLAVFADTTAHQVLEATVDGVRIPTEENWPQAGGGWHWGFLYTAVPASGLTVVLRLRGSGPVPIRVVSIAGGLPAGALALPAEWHWARWPSLAGQSFIACTVRV